ncbi:hypothetical protein [Frankia sp. Cj3]|uniref:hypothetical protein n=1 Tax=Frankia sp. Cj3 TaxID=2880976 RepID=UPI001EF6E3E7|nr:hypothetical protein [Frankia sp. Cj3]
MELLRKILGREAASLEGIFYLSQSIGAGPSLDSVELVFRDDGSILFTSATDWTLRVDFGTWPKLPEWCWPPRSWEFSRLETLIGDVGFDRVVGVADLRNDVGDLAGSVLEFDAGDLVIKAGDTIIVELHVG